MKIILLSLLFYINSAYTKNENMQIYGLNQAKMEFFGARINNQANMLLFSAFGDGYIKIVYNQDKKEVRSPDAINLEEMPELKWDGTEDEETYIAKCELNKKLREISKKDSKLKRLSKYKKTLLEEKKNIQQLLEEVKKITLIDEEYKTKVYPMGLYKALDNINGKIKDVTTEIICTTAAPDDQKAHIHEGTELDNLAK